MRVTEPSWCLALSLRLALRLFLSGFWLRHGLSCQGTDHRQVTVSTRYKPYASQTTQGMVLGVATLNGIDHVTILVLRTVHVFARFG